MIAGRFFLKNFEQYPVSDFTNPFTKNRFCIYEVLRTDEGIPLFLEDHIERLRQSFNVAGVDAVVNDDDLKTGILKLIKINGIEEGLIRIVYCFSDRDVDIIMFHSFVKFPSEEDYRKGVVCELQFAERDNPAAKVYNPEVREKANNLISEHKIYETLLVNAENKITEGSRSNVFFIKDDSIITAPDDAVLHGITRKKVISIIEDAGLTLNYELADVELLNKMDAVFITGTTPKVLPVREINNLTFNNSHSVIFKILNEYNRMIEDYKKSFGQGH